MPFFQKKAQKDTKRKRKADTKKNHTKISARKSAKPVGEISDSDTDVEANDSVYKDVLIEDDETAEEKHLRLTKEYLQIIEREEQRRLEVEEVSKDLIAHRLSNEVLKQRSKLHFTISNRYVNIGVHNVRLLKCRIQRATVTCLCVTSDNLFAFSGAKDGSMVKWSLKSGKNVLFLRHLPNVDRCDHPTGHSSSIRALAVTSDSKFLASADNSNNIYVWNCDTLEHIKTLKGHRGSVTGLTFRLNTHTLYSCSNDRSVRVWSLDEMTFVESLFGHQNSITSIHALTSERPITSGGADSTLRVWKIAEESQLLFHVKSKANIDIVRYLNDATFVVGADNGQISVWTISKKDPLCVVKAAHGLSAENGEPNWIISVATLTNSDVFATGSCDGFIRLWMFECRSKKITALVSLEMPGYVNALEFINDGKQLVAAVGKEHRLGRWSVKVVPNCIKILSFFEA